MKKGFIIAAVLGMIWMSGCASTSSKEMSAKDEARYAAAIERAEAEHPSAIPEGSEYVVAIGEVAAVDVQAKTADEMPAIARTFSVSRSEYDAFFAQSPATILGRMSLDPILDGGSLLGYRVKNLKTFSGVDLSDEDIIIGINGKLPQNPDEYFTQWEAAKASNECSVNIQRGVDRFELVWRVAE